MFCASAIAWTFWTKYTACPVLERFGNFAERPQSEEHPHKVGPSFLRSSPHKPGNRLIMCIVYCIHILKYCFQFLKNVGGVCFCQWERKCTDVAVLFDDGCVLLTWNVASQSSGKCERFWERRLRLHVTVTVVPESLTQPTTKSTFGWGWKNWTTLPPLCHEAKSSCIATSTFHHSFSSHQLSLPYTLPFSSVWKRKVSCLPLVPILFSFLDPFHFPVHHLA